MNKKILAIMLLLAAATTYLALTYFKETALTTKSSYKKIESLDKEITNQQHTTTHTEKERGLDLDSASFTIDQPKQSIAPIAEKVTVKEPEIKKTKRTRKPKPASESESSEEEPEKIKEKIAEEKVQVFEENMEHLQKQADEELSRMSPEERAEAEENMAQVQKNMAETMERLEKMSPEERAEELKKMEEEKNKVMEVLEKENPEAYKMFKSMEEMGDALQDLPLAQKNNE